MYVCTYIIISALSSLEKQAETTKSPLPYEVDGFRSSYYMDDANIPSLLSLPILSAMPPSHPLYLSTRKFLLSSSNPFFFSGKEGAGIGGPHVGFPNAWPMSIIVQAMTSSRGDGGMDEVKACLDLLLKASADTGLQHESFNVNDVHKVKYKFIRSHIYTSYQA